MEGFSGLKRQAHELPMRAAMLSCAVQHATVRKYGRWLAEREKIADAA